MTVPKMYLVLRERIDPPTPSPRTAFGLWRTRAAANAAIVRARASGQRRYARYDYTVIPIYMTHMEPSNNGIVPQ